MPFPKHNHSHSNLHRTESPLQPLTDWQHTLPHLCCLGPDPESTSWVSYSHPLNTASLSHHQINGNPTETSSSYHLNDHLNAGTQCWGVQAHGGWCPVWSGMCLSTGTRAWNLVQDSGMLPCPFTSYTSSGTGKDGFGVSPFGNLSAAPQQQGFPAEGIDSSKQQLVMPSVELWISTEEKSVTAYSGPKPASQICQ